MLRIEKIKQIVVSSLHKAEQDQKRREELKNLLAVKEEQIQQLQKNLYEKEQKLTTVQIGCSSSHSLIFATNSFAVSCPIFNCFCVNSIRIWD